MEQFFECRPQIVKHLSRKVRDESTRDDLLQEIFVKFASGFGGMKHRENLCGYPYRITDTTIADHYRRESRFVAADESVFEDSSTEHSRQRFGGYLAMKMSPVLPALLRGAVLTSALLLLTSTPAFSQWVNPLEPAGGRYKALAALSPEPNPARAQMDLIEYPWDEYSKGALANSLIRTVYLSREDEARLPPLIRFPANSSDQTRAELDYLLSLQEKRTKEEVARARYIANIGSFPGIINPTDPDYAENRRQLFYIATPVGAWYHSDNFPETAALLLNCIQDIRATEFRLKRHFKRPRPYHLEPKLQPLARIDSPSFASGHTLWAFTQAYIFSEILPERRGEFLKMAEEVRWSRELMGIHYPSDNEAARVVGWHLLNYWHDNPQFVADMEKAKVEWRARKESFRKK